MKPQHILFTFFSAMRLFDCTFNQTLTLWLQQRNICANATKRTVILVHIHIYVHIHTFEHAHIFVLKIVIDFHASAQIPEKSYVNSLHNRVLRFVYLVWERFMCNVCQHRRLLAHSISHNISHRSPAIHLVNTIHL